MRAAAVRPRPSDMSKLLLRLDSRSWLRPFAPDDAPALHQVFLDPEVKRYLLDGEEVGREWMDSVIADSRTDFDRGRGGLWSIVSGEDPDSPGDSSGADAAERAVVGFVGVRDFFEPPRRQLIYGLVPRAWGRGLATIAIRRVLEFLFEDLEWRRVEAATDEPNRASVRVLERLGFEPLEPDEAVAGGGTFGETLFFELSRERWRSAGFPEVFTDG